jgi:hypothetical protein
MGQLDSTCTASPVRGVGAGVAQREHLAVIHLVEREQRNTNVTNQISNELPTYHLTEKHQRITSSSSRAAQTAYRGYLLL